MTVKLMITACAGLCCCAAMAEGEGADVVLENARAKLVIGADAKVKSLKLKANGEELLDAEENISLFSSTQKRPFNNELKLIHPDKRTTYEANRIRRAGDTLVVGFETVPYEAVISVGTNDAFFSFTLEKFNASHGMHRDQALDYPPVRQFRLAQLPVKERANFGEWLNVMWDDKAAVAVMSVSGLEEIDSERRRASRVFSANLYEGLRLKGGRAAIVVGAGREDFMEAMDAFERANGLPLGVESRRSPLMKENIFCCSRVTEKTVDDWIAFCKQAGITLLKWGGWYWPENGFTGKEPERQELIRVLKKLHDAGIKSGLHLLQTYISISGRYARGACDPRLNLTRHFTLAEPIGTNDVISEIRVLEDPVDAPIEYKHKRLLRFDGELFLYEKYESEPVRRFTGIQRAHHKTVKREHQRGCIGGIVDLSGYFGGGCYINQSTDLQDEVAKRIGELYDLGFDFFYFDGSEGASEPCGIYVPYAQYRVVRACTRPVLFCEGSAKGHFDWHFLSGGNAFDCFGPEEFKAMTAKYALRNAAIAAKDFNRTDFGWWSVRVPDGKKNPLGTQFDMWEYGFARVIAWDCMTTMTLDPSNVKAHPRGADILETVRRWTDVRRRNLAPEDLKAKWRGPDGEWHLYLNDKGEYEFLPLTMLAAPNAKGLRAFVCERNGKRLVCYWHTSGEGDFTVSLGGERKLHAANRAYLETDLSVEDVVKAFKEAK